MVNGDDDDDDLDFFLLVKNLTGRICSRFLDKSSHDRCWHDNPSRISLHRHRGRHTVGSSSYRDDGDKGKCRHCGQAAHVNGPDMVGISHRFSDVIFRQNPKTPRSISPALASDAIPTARSVSLGFSGSERNDVSQDAQVARGCSILSDVMRKEGICTDALIPDSSGALVKEDAMQKENEHVSGSPTLETVMGNGYVAQNTENTRPRSDVLETGLAKRSDSKHEGDCPSRSDALETGLGKRNDSKLEDICPSRSDVLETGLGKRSDSKHKGDCPSRSDVLETCHRGVNLIPNAFFKKDARDVLAVKNKEVPSISDGGLGGCTSESSKENSNAIWSSSGAKQKGQSITCSELKAGCNVPHSDEDMFKVTGNITLEDVFQTRKSNDGETVPCGYGTSCIVDVKDRQTEQVKVVLEGQAKIEAVFNSVKDDKPVTAGHSVNEVLSSKHMYHQDNLESTLRQTLSLSCLQSGSTKKRPRFSAVRDFPEGCCKSPKFSPKTPSDTCEGHDVRHLPEDQNESLHNGTEDSCSTSVKLSAENTTAHDFLKQDVDSCWESQCEVYVPERNLDHGKFSENSPSFIDLIDLTEDDDEDVMEISKPGENVPEVIPCAREGNTGWEIVPHVPFSSFPQRDCNHKIDWIVESEEISPELNTPLLVDLAVQPETYAFKDNIQSTVPLKTIRSETNRNSKDYSKPSSHVARSKVFQPSIAVSSLKESCPEPVDGISARSLVKRILHEFESLRKFISKSNNNVRRPDLDAAGKLKDKWQNNGDKIVGDVPGVEVGDQFSFRIEMVIIGLHRQIQSGIDYIPVAKGSGGLSIATSIVASGGYEDDVDDGETLIYSGQGGNNYRGDKRQKSDQRLERGNLALSNSMREKTPVRVIRGMSDANSSSLKIYTYDGLYDVVDQRFDRGASGFGVYTFKLVRRPGQPQVGLSFVQFVGSLKKRGLVRPNLLLEDISQGQERLPVCVVNEVDSEPAPLNFHYIPDVLYPSWFSPTEPQGCDCVGECSDESNCRCAQRNGGEFPYNEKGYIIQDKKVIHECGISCRCLSSCPNRVTQKGLRYQLEIFKTKDRGWGVRSLNSIQPGGFICEYVGELLSDAEAEKRINNDEYLFDLGNYCDPSTGAEPLAEDVSYTIDAKSLGNVARFINHSCSPNLFAQNVLYDSDDMRFPHVMLFAMENIPPMRELTYDYNYSIDQVHDAYGNIKKKACYCGAPDCRGRLY